MSAESPPVEVRPSLRTFVTIWIGQVISLFGSGLTTFAIGVWVYQRTGSVTLFTLIAVAASIPAVLLSPIAGALVDRWDRRMAMIVSDAGAALTTAALLALLVSDRLELWHLYVLVALSSAFNAIQFPAFSAATTLLVPKRHFGRAGGMMQLGQAGAQILAPLLAGVLMVSIRISGVVAVDLATFVVAVVLLLLVRVPNPPRAATAGKPSLLREAAFGWTYIRERPGLLSLLGYFSALNLLIPFGIVLATPLVLSFAGADDLGFVLSAASAGGLAGGLVMSAWGGPRTKMLGVLGFGPLVTLGFVVAGLRPSLPLVAGGLFLVFFVIPVINGSSQAIWQSKVEPSVQGRVFAVRRMVAQLTAPIAYLAAGPLADRVFQPLLSEGGALAGSLGKVIGTGPGRGIASMFLVMGGLFLLVTALGLSSPGLRNLEQDLPDALPGEARAASGPEPAGAPGG